MATSSEAQSPSSSSTANMSGGKRVPIHLQSAANRLLIKNGNVVNEEGVVRADLYIEDGIIKQMGEHLIIPGGTRLIDASNRYVMPAGIDMDVWLQRQMVHFNTQSIDDLYQGTRAALAGGTTVVATVAEVEENESLIEAFNKWRAWGEQRACCDFVIKIKLNEINEGVKREMETLVKDEAFGVNVFILDNLNEDNDLIAALNHCRQLGVLAQVRPEYYSLSQAAIKEMKEDHGVLGPEGLAMAITEANEEAAVIRLMTMAEHTKCPLLIGPLTTNRSVSAIARQRSRPGRGTMVYSYTIPAALACDGEVYFNPSWHQAASFTLRPPLKIGQREKLAKAMTSSDIDLVASEHCTFSKRQRALGRSDFELIPVGVNGVQSRMNVLYETCVHSDNSTAENKSGLMDVSRFVEATSTLPAKLLNLWPRRGRIEVGSQADIVIWNPMATRLISSSDHELKTDMNIFEGMRCHGVPELVITHNKPVVEEGGVLRVSEGMGKHVQVAPFPPFIFEKMTTLIHQTPDALRRAVVRANIDDGMANGDSNNKNDLPKPTLPPETRAVSAPSQHLSKLDLSQHAEPVFNKSNNEANTSNGNNEDQCDATVTRSSVRVRAPPGGKSVGGFW